MTIWFRCRPSGRLFLWPRSEFWHIWGTAALFAAVLFILFGTSNAWPAEHVLPQEPFFSWFFGGPQPQQPARPYRYGGQRKQPASSLLSGPIVSSSVLAEARRWIGSGNVTGSHRAWCADFINFVLRRTGHRGSGSGLAISLLRVGPRVAPPQPGDIAVMRNHGTFFAGYSPRGFYGLGGNQYHIVRLSQFSLRRIIAFVRPQ